MTPIERAARALWEHGYGTWELATPETQDEMRDSVRAVLQAIREPSEGMAMAGEVAGDAAAYPTSCKEDGFGDEAELGHYGALAVWTAMIDAALAE